MSDLPANTTFFKLKLQETDQKAAYDISVRYFHLKALIAVMIIGTECILQLAPLIGYPGIVVPEGLNMLTASVVGTFFFSKGTTTPADTNTNSSTTTNTTTIK